MATLSSRPRDRSFPTLSFVAALGLSASFGGALFAGACSGGSDDSGGAGAVADSGSESGDEITLMDAFQCQKGEFKCVGNVAKKCDGKGGFTDSIDCGDALGCAERTGCVVCSPGESTCASGMAKWCLPDGSGYVEFECDATQGMTCSPTGCTGKCTPAELFESYLGCDYYPTVTLNSVWTGFPFAVAVANTSDTVVNIVVTQGTNPVATGQVQPQGAKILELPWVAELKGGDVNSCQIPPPPGATRLVSAGAYRLRTDGPVTVYQFSPLSYKIDPVPTGCPLGKDCPGGHGDTCLAFTNDASLLLPVTAMTKTYSVLAWPSQKDRAGYAAITATRDGTEVKVIGGGTTIAAGAGIDGEGNGTVAMKAGDVLQIVAASNPAADTYGPDLSGMRIQATQPVQVLAGHSCANIPVASTPACDHLEELMFPVDTLGTDYLVTVPSGLPDPSPHTIRIAAVEEGTKVHFDPPLVQDTTLTPTAAPLQVKDVLQDVRITSNKAILVAQYMQSQESVPNKLGDPSLSLVVPTQQFRKAYVFVASSTFDANYVNVILKTGTTVTLDGQKLEEAGTAIGTSGYSVVRQALGKAEQHKIEGDQPFGIIVYGYGQYTSYMYPGGLDLKHITVPPIY